MRLKIKKFRIESSFSTKCFVLLFLHALIANVLHGQPKMEWRAPQDSSLFIADFDSLHKTLLDTHPNLFAFIPEKQWNENYAELRERVRECNTLEEFAYAVARLIVPFRDSHTTLDFYDLPRYVFEAKSHILPMNIVSHGDTLFIQDEWEALVPSGSILKSINGVDAMEIYQCALDYSCIEGNSYNGQTRVADAIFPIICAWHYNLDSLNVLEVEDPITQAIANYELLGYDGAAYKRGAKKRAALPERRAVQFEYNHEQKLAILKVNTFAPAQALAYKRSIRRAFKTMQHENCNRLILDIRDNGGGSSGWVEYLYAWLDVEGYNTPKNVIGKSSALAKDRARHFNKGISKIIINLLYRNDEDVQSFKKLFELPIGEMDTTYFTKPTVHKKRQVYQKQCVLLINGLTASAGVDFTNQFKKSARGKIFGEECLGPITGTFGNPAPYALPNTGLRLNIATIRYNYDNSFQYDPNPIIPDVVIRTTGSDLKEKRDPVLDEAKKYLSNNNQ